MTIEELYGHLALALDQKTGETHSVDELEDMIKEIIKIMVPVRNMLKFIKDFNVSEMKLKLHGTSIEVSNIISYDNFVYYNFKNPVKDKSLVINVSSDTGDLKKLSNVSLEIYIQLIYDLVIYQ
jgi:hypothetical protein